MPKKIWINAGELSGDLHGKMLVQALLQENNSVEFIGMGGSLMEEAGVKTVFRIEELSVMGFTEVFGHLPKIIRLLRQIKERMIREKPEALIVIDAPEFHFRVIKIAHSLGIPVYYYISPKLWAWRQNRAKFIQRYVRRLISILPFEEAFYQQFGMQIDYVGNPLADMVNYQKIKDIQPTAGHIGILPGSRKKEITSLLPEFGGAARILLQRHPHLLFTCVRAPNMQDDFLRAYWPQDVPLAIVSPENRWATMRLFEMIVAASGTVTLEAALAGVPTIAAYKVSPVTYKLAKMVVNIPYISLANLILQEEVIPECIQEACDAEPLATKVEEWITPATKEESFARIAKQYARLRGLLGPPGAVQRAAKIILDDIRSIGK